MFHTITFVWRSQVGLGVCREEEREGWQGAYLGRRPSDAALMRSRAQRGIRPAEGSLESGDIMNFMNFTGESGRLRQPAQTRLGCTGPELLAAFVSRGRRKIPVDTAALIRKTAPEPR
jgi:hypothetical protein